MDARSPAAAYLLGFDVGGSRLKGGVVDPAGGLSRPTAQQTGPAAHADQLVGAILDQARAFRSELAEASCRGVGVALPGFVEPTFGARHLPGKLPGMERFPLREVLERELDVPVRCLGDGAAAALAEWRVGSGAGEDDVVVITLGTGVGSGVVMNGRLLANRHLGTGGSVGQFTIQADGQLCLCGNRGCAETLISATAIEGRLRDHLARGVRSSLSLQYAERPDSINFESLIHGAQSGDRLCLDVLAGFVRHLGATIVSAVHAYNPSVVVLSGGPMESADHFLPAVQAYVDEHRWIYPADRPLPVRSGRLGLYAGVIGAALYAALDARPAPHARPDR